MWLEFTKTFPNGKMNYVSNLCLDVFYNPCIQKFFIWGHLVPRLTKFDQVKSWIFFKRHFERTRDGFNYKSHKYKVYPNYQGLYLVQWSTFYLRKFEPHRFSLFCSSLDDLDSLISSSRAHTLRQEISAGNKRERGGHWGKLPPT